MSAWHHVAGDRVKIIDHGSRYYGRVGTVIWNLRGVLMVELDDGTRALFDWDALRNVTKRRRSA